MSSSCTTPALANRSPLTEEEEGRLPPAVVDTTARGNGSTSPSRSTAPTLMSLPPTLAVPNCVKRNRGCPGKEVIGNQPSTSGLNSFSVECEMKRLPGCLKANSERCRAPATAPPNRAVGSDDEAAPPVSPLPPAWAPSGGGGGMGPTSAVCATAGLEEDDDAAPPSAAPRGPRHMPPVSMPKETPTWPATCAGKEFCNSRTRSLAANANCISLRAWSVSPARPETARQPSPLLKICNCTPSGVLSPSNTMATDWRKAWASSALR
mmetsp:Transcript_73807/g.213793  ORF Transcript_73807/g.213793 Transcript_73807/m.213793 type:complete len:265 (+) Transcript_73807:462-1256(+)